MPRPRNASAEPAESSKSTTEPAPTEPTEAPTVGPTMFLDPTSKGDPTTPGPSSSTSEDRAARLAGDVVGPGSGSSPRSTSKRGDLLPIARRALKTAGGATHVLLTVRRPVERRAGLWLPETEELDDAASGLAGLVARRAPEGAATPDVRDLFALVFAVLGYVIRNGTLRAELAEREDFYAGPDVVDDRADDDDGSGSAGGGPAGDPDQTTPPPGDVEPVSAARGFLGRRQSGITAGAPAGASGAVVDNPAPPEPSPSFGYKP